jgi:N-acetylglutamate synthase-like GNAT family acetyltransferase
MNIRIASRNDIPLITKLIRTSFRSVAERFDLTEANCPRHPSRCTDEWVCRDFDAGRDYFILEDEKPVGCVALEAASGGVFYLERLAVLPDKRRCGHGSALVRHIFGEARRRGGAAINIGIIDEQQELKQWYETFGFRLTGSKVFPHLPVTVAFMSYNISD